MAMSLTLGLMFNFFRTPVLLLLSYSLTLSSNLPENYHINTTAPKYKFSGVNQHHSTEDDVDSKKNDTSFI